MTPGEILFQIGREKGRISASALADEMCRRLPGTRRDAAIALIQYHARRGNLITVGTAKPGRYRGRSCKVFRVARGAHIVPPTPPGRKGAAPAMAYSAAVFAITRAWHEARR